MGHCWLYGPRLQNSKKIPITNQFNTSRTPRRHRCLCPATLHQIIIRKAWCTVSFGPSNLWVVQSCQKISGGNAQCFKMCCFLIGKSEKKKKKKKKKLKGRLSGAPGIFRSFPDFNSILTVGASILSCKNGTALTALGAAELSVDESPVDKVSFL